MVYYALRKQGASICGWEPQVRSLSYWKHLLNHRFQQSKSVGAMLPALFHDWFGDWAEEVGVWGNWAWIVFVILMMIMANLGYSVYHVAMIKHSNSNIMLTNVIYQQMAALFQGYVSVIAANVRAPLSSLYHGVIHISIYRFSSCYWLIQTRIPLSLPLRSSSTSTVS